MKPMMLSNMRRWQGWTKLEQTKTPTLVITSERDRYFPRRVFQGVGERIAGGEVGGVGGSPHKGQLGGSGGVHRARGGPPGAPAGASPGGWCPPRSRSRCCWRPSHSNCRSRSRWRRCADPVRSNHQPPERSGVLCLMKMRPQHACRPRNPLVQGPEYRILLDTQNGFDCL